MFERLTKRMSSISYVMCGNVILSKCENCNNRMPSCYEEDCGANIEALKRLAAYEDAGLLPEEVRALAEVRADGRLVVLPAKVGYRVKVDARTLPWHYLHPADRCGDFANCMVIGFSATKRQTFMKLVALYPSRMNRRGYLRYSVGAIGKTVFCEAAEKALEVGE